MNGSSPSPPGPVMNSIEPPGLGAADRPVRTRTNPFCPPTASALFTRFAETLVV